MNTKSMILSAVLLSLGGTAQAAPVSYEGTLSIGDTVTGSVAGFGWGDEDGAQVDFWQFDGTMGQVVDLRVDRLDSGFDPALSLYFGVTSADEVEFINDADWGGLTFLDFADDEISRPGGTGDPWLDDFSLPFTGTYTLAVGGFFSDDDGPYDYRLIVEPAVTTPMPIPGPALLMVGGLMGLGWLRSGTGHRTING